MIIYFEGPDGAGKSTLIDAVDNELRNRENDFSVCKHAEQLMPTHPKDKNRMLGTHVISKLFECANDDDNIYLIDRGLISDWVYRLFDGYKPVCDIRTILNVLSEIVYNDKGIIVYCNSALAEQKMLERGDDNPIALQRHKEISHAFDLVFYDSIDYIEYDMEDGVEDGVHQIMQRLKEITQS